MIHTLYLFQDQSPTQGKYSMGFVRWSKLVVLSCAALTRSVHGVQIPFQAPTATIPSPNSKSATLGVWNFNVVPNLNSTSHLIFDTVGSLSQHWTNTRYRNGHNIVPGTVPIGTLLYHGTYKHEVPTAPDWTATDPEHSFVFCRNAPTHGGTESGCWHLTLVVTRPLKVLYFDGNSAAKMEGGPMDSQDITAWGEIKPEWTWNERVRIDRLCEWGREFGLDGFMRMEMDFEIMLCDFTRGVEIVSFLNLNPGQDTHPALTKSSGSEHEVLSNLPPPDDVASYGLHYRVIEAGLWHNTYPGETRIKLDLNGLISFYDTDLFPSLAAARFGQERWDHRLQRLSAVDLKTFQARIREVLIQNEYTRSGVDWSTLIRVVVDRYAERLEILQYLLNTTRTVEHAQRVQGHLRSMVVPYVLHTSVPNSESINQSWALPVYKLCATTHTRYISSTPSISTRMTRSESLILRSVKEVSKEICRVVVGMWAEGVELGLDTISPVSTSPSVSGLEPKSAAIIDAMPRWQERTEGLMAWLDWSVWVKCKPACRYEEICYLPTWPFLDGPDWPPVPQLDVGRRRMRAQPQGSEDEEEGFLRPQPKCIRRVEPFGV